MTTTHIKFLLTVEDHAFPEDQRTVDETIKRLFVKLHHLYVEYTLNPFSQLSAPIVSSRFDTKAKELVTAYNRTTA
jgi:Sedlin, N-terminal conserved region